MKYENEIIYEELSKSFGIEKFKLKNSMKPLLHILPCQLPISISHKNDTFTYLISDFNHRAGIDIENILCQTDWSPFFNRFFNFEDSMLIHNLKSVYKINNPEALIFSMKESALKKVLLQVDPLLIYFNKIQELDSITNKLRLFKFDINIKNQEIESEIYCFYNEDKNQILSICIDKNLSHCTNFFIYFQSLEIADFSSISQHLFVMKGMLLRAPDSFFPKDLISDLIQPYQIAIDQKIHESQQRQSPQYSHI